MTTPLPPKPRKPLRISLRIGLSLAILIMVLGTSTVLSGVLFLRMQEIMRDDIRDRIRDVAALASLSVDGELHREVRSREDELKPPYRTLKARMQEVRRQVPELRFVYTLKRTQDGSLYFWVDAESDEEIGTHVGDPVTEVTPTMHQAFDEPEQVHTEPTFYTDRWGTWLTGYAPVRAADGTLECVLAVDISATRIAAAENSALFMLAAIAVLITAVVALLGVFLSGRIIRPLAQLEHNMLRVRDLDLTPTGEIDTHIIEIHRMRDTLDTMKSGLRSFRRYVPTTLVRELVRQCRDATLGGHRAELTVFFSDIQGFTTYSETTSAENLTADLADYFALITGAILASGGTVDKYIGDAVMAFWGAPNPQADHAERALRTALAIQRGLAEMNRRRIAAGKYPLHTRIGLATGEVVVGNFGYAERFNYTVMGDTVNLASRLEGLNRYIGTRILATATTLHRSRGTIVGRIHGLVAVKGKHEAVRIVEPVAAHSRSNDALLESIRAWNEAYQRYIARDFAGALPGFAAWAELYPTDEPARTMVASCQAFIASPPPPEWRATVVMESK